MTAGKIICTLLRRCVPAIEDMASYVVRNPVSLKRLVYIEGQQAVIYRALKPKPRLGANFVTMDPLEWLARVADHIPDPGKHRTLSYGHYANRARGARAREEALLDGAKDEAPEKRRCSPSWARLVAKAYHADPSRVASAGAGFRSWPTSTITSRTRRSSTTSAQPARDRAAATRHPPTPRGPRGTRARKPGGRGAIRAVAGLGEGLAGAIREPWCVAVRWGEPPQGPGGRTRGQLRGVDPCRAPRGGRGGPGRPAATVVGRAQAKENAYRVVYCSRGSSALGRERPDPQRSPKDAQSCFRDPRLTGCGSGVSSGHPPARGVSAP